MWNSLKQIWVGGGFCFCFCFADSIFPHLLLSKRPLHVLLPPPRMQLNSGQSNIFLSSFHSPYKHHPICANFSNSPREFRSYLCISEHRIAGYAFLSQDYHFICFVPEHKLTLTVCWYAIVNVSV